MRILIFALGACAATAAEGDRIKIDGSILADIPTKRRAALMLFAITGRDSSPAIGEKKAKYVEALKTMIQDLRSAYYWHSEFPKDVDAAIEKRAVYLAGLRYPASPTTGASYYGDLVQSYSIRMYEEQLVTIAYAVTERFLEPDVAVVGGTAQSFTTWKKAWDDAGEVKNGPNKAPEPTPTSVMPPANSR